MKYPKYLFLTYGSYESHWWTIQDDNSLMGCSPEERAEVLQFSLAALHFPPFPGNASNDSCQGIVCNSYTIVNCSYKC